MGVAVAQRRRQVHHPQRDANDKGTYRIRRLFDRLRRAKDMAVRMRQAVDQLPELTRECLEHNGVDIYSNLQHPDAIDASILVRSFSQMIEGDIAETEAALREIDLLGMVRKAVKRDEGDDDE